MNRFFARKRNIGFLLLTVVLMTLFSWFVITFPPNTILNNVLFYIILFGISFSFLFFVFAKAKTALVYASGFVLYFLLRFLHLRHPIYGVLLFICCVAVLRLISPKEKQTKIE